MMEAILPEVERRGTCRSCLIDSWFRVRFRVYARQTRARIEKCSLGDMRPGQLPNGKSVMHDLQDRIRVRIWDVGFETTICGFVVEPRGG